MPGPPIAAAGAPAPPALSDKALAALDDDDEICDVHWRFVKAVATHLGIDTGGALLKEEKGGDFREWLLLSLGFSRNL